MVFPSITINTCFPRLFSTIRLLLLILSMGLLLPSWTFAQPTPSAKPAKSDFVIFTNGDRLTGRLVQVIGGKVKFHSDILGDITVPWSRIKTLHSQEQFAVVDKDERLTKRTAAGQITFGSVTVEDNRVDLIPAHGTPRSFQTNNTQYFVDAPSLRREITNQADLLFGWTGNITLGASLVQGTDTSQTYTGTVGLVRAVPTVSWLPPSSRTSLNLTGTYGLSTQPQIFVNGNLIQAASTAKTNILHGDMEYDRYVSRKAFWLAMSSADHNLGSGLQLQQTYGLGVGWTIIKDPKQTLDLKTNLHYQQQQFYNGVLSNLGTPNENLIGADFTESWAYIFAHNVKVSQNMTATPAFNVVQAYSAAANANLIFPIHKNLSFTLSSTDNYLGDPPAGYQRNTFQLTAGITYLIK